LEDETGLSVARQDRRRTQTLDVVGNLSELINKMNLVVLLVSVLCLMNTMIMSVLERYKEIGMMRSIGATRSQIRRMILQEGILFAFIGGLLGIAQGMFFSGTMVEAMESFVRFKVTNIQDFRYMGEILLVVLFMAYLAALYPAQQAAQQVIVEAIKGE
jgi:putative ABC transport system permease protein